MIFFLFFFLLGISSITAQVVILREISFSFYGNEFFIGITLGFWLLITAAGSWLGEKIFSKNTPGKIAFIFLAISFLLLPLVIVILRVSFLEFFGRLAAPTLLSGFIYIFFVILPICLLLGFLFPLGIKSLNYAVKNKGGTAYFWETLGFVFGGLLFSFLLFRTSFPLTARLNEKLMKLKLPDLVKTVYTKYGIVSVSQQAGQINFYQNSKLFSSSHQEESCEYKIHLIFSFAENPKKILIVGNGFWQINEILKYQQVEAIDYFELNPEINIIAPEFLPPVIRNNLNDKRVNVKVFDPRLFINQNGKNYDVVIFNLPNPSTAFINRLYTAEAFRAVKKTLAKNGVFSFSIYLPTDYLSDESADFAGLIDKTAKSVFKQVKILPENNQLLFLAADFDLNPRAEILQKRFEQRNIQSDFFTAEYLNYRLTKPKIRQIENTLNQLNLTKINSDFYPLAYYFQNAFWQTKYSFGLAKIFTLPARLNPLLFFLIIIPVLAVLLNKVKGKKDVCSVFIFFNGFVLMVFEILIIYCFQVVLGFVFERIALLTALALAGMALGNRLVLKIKTKPLKLIFYWQVFLSFYCLLFVYLMKIPSEFAYYFLSLIIGGLCGLAFPVCSKVYKKTGNLYALDLLGAFAGCFLTSIFLLPLLGVYLTVVLIVIVNFVIMTAFISKFPGF